MRVSRAHVVFARGGVFARAAGVFARAAVVFARAAVVVLLLVFVLIRCFALRIVAVVCVGDLQCVESFETPFRSVSESPALESYEHFGPGEAW